MYDCMYIYIIIKYIHPYIYIYHYSYIQKYIFYCDFSIFCYIFFLFYKNIYIFHIMY